MESPLSLEAGVPDTKAVFFTIPDDFDGGTFTGGAIDLAGSLAQLGEQIRAQGIKAGTKVLVVDQWVETGGTMGAAIELVRRQGGIVAGLAAIAIEENPVTDAYRREFRCVSGVVPSSRWQAECNAQKLESFKSYRPELVFPTVR